MTTTQIVDTVKLEWISGSDLLVDMAPDFGANL